MQPDPLEGPDYKVERRREPCAQCGKLCRSQTGLCRSCWRSQATESVDSCLLCRATTRAKDRHCASCAAHINAARSYRPTAADALTDGQWVRKGLIHIWREAS